MHDRYIGIVSSMNVEFNYIKKILKIKKTIRKGGYKAAISSFAGIHLILIKTGVGLEKASKATKFFLDNYNIKAVINIGIAGAVKPGLKIGDLVLGENIFFEADNIDEDLDQIYSSDEKMLEALKRILSTKENPWYRGAIVSVKKGVFCTERKNHIHQRFTAHAVDMEAAALIEACGNVPFVTVKSISDLADESTGFSEDMFNNTGRIILIKILRMFICHPFLTIAGIRSMVKNVYFALSRLQWLLERFKLSSASLPNWYDGIWE